MTRYRSFSDGRRSGPNHGARSSGHHAGNAPRQKTEAELQAECDAWNDKHPVGTVVDYFETFMHEKGKAAPSKRYVTRSRATILGGHTAILWLHGKSGCVSLDHCIAAELPTEGA